MDLAIVRELIDALLKDDNGISERAYYALIEFLRTDVAYNAFGGFERDCLLAYVRLADATDGRFYFSEEK